MTLRDLLIDVKAEIIKLNLSTKDFTRLRELGLSEGSYVTCIRHTPFGGPRVYQVGNSVFSMDHQIADAIEVKRVEK